MANVLELENISKRFGDLEILKGVDLRVGAGESVAILGPSGAGKSTLLHISGLMEKASSGKVRIMDRSADEFTEANRDRERLGTIGFLFQFHYLLPDFNVLENTLMPARLAGDSLMQAEARAREVLGRLGLTPRLSHKPHQLSGGEQQRTALARALMRNPKILLCDEPTGNLDEKTADDVLALIWEEIRREKVAAVIVTHNQKIADRTDRAYRLSEGHLR